MPAYGSVRPGYRDLTQLDTNNHEVSGVIRDWLEKKVGPAGRA